MIKTPDRLKELRKELNKTQKQVAQELTMAKTTYSGYETGYSQPSQEILVLLANYYNVTVDYLIGNTNLKVSQQSLNMINDIDLSNEELMKKYHFTLGEQEIDVEQIIKLIEVARMLTKEIKK